MRSKKKPQNPTPLKPKRRGAGKVEFDSLEGKSSSEALPLLTDSDRLLVIRRSTSSRSAFAAAELEVGTARRRLSSPTGTRHATPAPHKLSRSNRLCLTKI